MTDRDAFTALLKTKQARERWLDTVRSQRPESVRAAAKAAYQELKADLEAHGLVESEERQEQES